MSLYSTRSVPAPFLKLIHGEASDTASYPMSSLKRNGRRCGRVVVLRVYIIILLCARPPPPVSIGLPVYNGAPYLAETLGDLQGQTFGDFELVVCDNASTDDTPDLVQEGRDS